jgi:hypothetical protein
MVRQIGNGQDLITFKELSNRMVLNSIPIDFINLPILLNSYFSSKFIDAVE